MFLYGNLKDLFQTSQILKEGNSCCNEPLRNREIVRRGHYGRVGVVRDGGNRTRLSNNDYLCTKETREE